MTLALRQVRVEFRCIYDETGDNGVNTRELEAYVELLIKGLGDEYPGVIVGMVSVEGRHFDNPHIKGFEADKS